MQRQTVSLEQKMRYLREIENIHRLSKRVLPPKGTTWARIADKHLQRALGMPIREDPETLDLVRSRHMHQHSPRTARVVERTLRNGMIHPDVLHSYRDGTSMRTGKPKAFFKKPARAADTPDVIHYVQHGSSDLVYPHGHLQGYGFVPSQHEVVSHVQLEDSVRPATDAVPTKAADSGYH